MKKPRLTDDVASCGPSRSTTRLGALPPQLAELVLHFTLGKMLLHPGFHSFEPFQAFAGVCKEWFALLDEVVSKRAMACARHNFHKPSRQRVLELRRKLILRRAYTKRMIVDRAPNFGDLTEQFWLATLSHMPRLKKIDLDSSKKHCLPAHRLADVVKAASAQCPHLKHLAFAPTIPLSRAHERDRFPVKNRMAVLANALYEAMQRWSKYEGLRVLHLDMGRFMADFARADAHFASLVQHCPKLAALDGVETLQMEHKMCEQWWVSLEMWDKFSRECQALQMLNWTTVPFATAYFETFGRYEHKQLGYMVLAAHVEWNWQGFLNAADSATRKAVETRGFRERAVNPELALRGCPNLTQLEIQWYCHEDDASMEEGSMDPAVFDDEFFEAAVTHCKKLKTVGVKFVGGTRPQTLVNLTDRSLRALTNLPHLTKLTFDLANVSGGGVFDFFTSHATSTRARREFKFTLGEAPGDDASSTGMFYETVKAFLQRLMAHNAPLPYLTRDVLVTFSNCQPRKVESAWSEAYLREVRDLVAAAQAKYPSLLFRGRLNTKEPNTVGFDSINGFSIATKSFSVDDMWSKLGTEREPSTIDGIFSIDDPVRPSVRRSIDDSDDDIDFRHELDDEMGSLDDDSDNDDRGEFDDYEEDSDGYDE